MSKGHILLVTHKGSAIDLLVEYVLVNHGIAKVTVTRDDGRTYSLSVAVDASEPTAHSTLTNWSKH